MILGALVDGELAVECDRARAEVGEEGDLTSLSIPSL